MRLPWGGNANASGVDKDVIIVSGACVISGKLHMVQVPRSAFERWIDGTLIQDAFPNLSNEQREFIKSGISPDGWKEGLPEEE
jgi:hypothetical protein